MKIPRIKRYRFSILQRLSLAMVFMILLVVLASSIGLWYTTQVDSSNQSVRLGMEQLTAASELQNSWLEMTYTLDSITDFYTEQQKSDLDSRLNVFSSQIETLSQQPPGLSPETVAQNQEIITNLVQVNTQAGKLIAELDPIMAAGDWSAAQEKRQSTLASLNNQINENLYSLTTNIQNDIANQMLSISNLQQRFRIYWLGAVGVGLLLAFLIAILTQRTINRPINQLITDIQKITEGEEEIITPLKQRDEIGDLSRAFAMMTDWLKESQETLEKRVEERTLGLEKRTVQIQVAAQVARDISANRDLEDLLRQAVILIRDRFGFYHAGLFLVDERHEYAIIRAATGEAGREMLDREHRLKIGETGLVGYAAYSGLPRISADVAFDLEHYKNPLLPETRSEAAIPLKVGNEVIGVLDVQSQEPAAFDEDSIIILQVMSDQIAIAIQNARLLESLQDSMKELEATHRQFDHEAWKRFSQTAPTLGFEFDGIEIRPITKGTPPPVGTAGVELAENTPQISAGQEPIQIPLKVRDEVIGTLDIWPQEDELSMSDVYLLTSIGNRISQVLESARLLKEAERLANREQQINWITSQVISSVNMDTILKSTVKELGQTLGTTRTYIHIHPEYPHAEKSSMDEEGDQEVSEA